MWEKIKSELFNLLGKNILIDGIIPIPQHAKVVTVATNEKEDNYYIGVLPIGGLNSGETAISRSNKLDWIRYLPEYSDTGVYWIDKTMVGKIKELKYLTVRF